MIRNKIVILILILLLITNFTAVIPNYAAQGWDYDYGLGGREMPFRPPDKYVTKQNPPDFSWPLISDAESYELKVCKSSSLSDIVFSKNGIKTNYYNFDSSFATGTYYWSVRYFAQGSYSLWSEAKRFRIDD